MAACRWAQAAGADGITVSTLMEAEQFFAAGFSDVLYAVAIAPAKLDRVLALRRRWLILFYLTSCGVMLTGLGQMHLRFAAYPEALGAAMLPVLETLKGLSKLILKDLKGQP